MNAIGVVGCDLKQLLTINGAIEDRLTPIAVRGRVLQPPLEFEVKGTGPVERADGSETKGKT